MNHDTGYTSYHPRWFRKRISTYWWLERRSYLVFILRELSSVFVAWFVLYFLLLVRVIGLGDTAYQRFLEWSAHPLLLTVNAMSLVFIVFHAITWFNLTPAALAVRVRGKRVPPFFITAPNFVLWVIVSLLLAWLVVGAR